MRDNWISIVADQKQDQEKKEYKKNKIEVIKKKDISDRCIEFKWNDKLFLKLNVSEQIFSEKKKKENSLLNYVKVV